MGDENTSSDMSSGESAVNSRLEQIANATAADMLAYGLIEPEQIIELRILGASDGKDDSTYSGMFRGSEASLMARWALQYSGLCRGVYYTINPIRPERFAVQMRRVNRADSATFTKDSHILCRRWLMIDVDPIRGVGGSKKTSSTDMEKAASFEVACQIQEFLRNDEGWAARPIFVDSGNGYHLLYRTENMPVTLPIPDSDPMRLALRYMAQRFNSKYVDIDTNVFNPSRMAKFPNTLACKGEATEERPHRRAKIVKLTDLPMAVIAPATPDATTQPAPAPNSPSGLSGSGPDDPCIF